MSTLETARDPFTAHLALLVFVLVDAKYLCALAFSFGKTSAFAWAPIFGVRNYADAFFAVQVFAALLLFGYALRTGAFQKLLLF